MRVFLEGLLPRLFPELEFLCVAHEGKQDLEKSIPRKLKAWNEPGARFCIVRDNDGGDFKNLKASLLELCPSTKRDEVLVRIACQELEAWYFGDPHALADAFGREDLRRISTRRRYRDPDAIDQPSRALRELVEEFQKVSGARAMASRLSIENSSASFNTLMSGIARLSGAAHPSQAQ